MPLRPQPNCQRTPNQLSTTHAVSRQSAVGSTGNRLPQERTSSRSFTELFIPNGGTLILPNPENAVNRLAKIFFFNLPSHPADKIREDIRFSNHCQQAHKKNLRQPVWPRQPVNPNDKKPSLGHWWFAVNSPHNLLQNPSVREMPRRLASLLNPSAPIISATMDMASTQNTKRFPEPLTRSASTQKRRPLSSRAPRRIGSPPPLSVVTSVQKRMQ